MQEKIVLSFDAYGKKFGFKDKDPAKAIKELAEKLDGKSRWFAEMFSFISKYRSKFTFTDIFIQENRLVYVARPLLPLVIKQPDGGTLLPKRDEILSIVEKFLELKSTDIIKFLLQRKSGIDFSFSLYGFGNLRCNFSHSANGVNLTIRILPFQIPSFSNGYFSEIYKEFFSHLLMEKKVYNPFSENERTIISSTIRRGGLILHVGQTGTGKTTALASEIDYLANKVNGVILTYENPIEYIFSSEASQTKALVTQYDIDGHFSGSFQGVLKHLLRNTPSVAMIGEVRSLDEIENLIDIASRGHLIFATMHASNCREALDILFSIKKKEQLSNTLLAIMAHRLGTVIDNTQGERRYRIVPFFESLLPQKNTTLKALIEKGDAIGISKLLDESRSRDYYVSFEAHLFDLVRNKVITEEQKRTLEALI